MLRLPTIENVNDLFLVIGSFHLEFYSFVACFTCKHVSHVLSTEPLVSDSQFNVVILQAVLTEMTVYSVIEYIIYG